uniref:Uncharacterized protein n=1 Tax=Arundo donax TaxID=35708 RepID=A0A0A9C6I4_ARUDO
MDSNVWIQGNWVVLTLCLFYIFPCINCIAYTWINLIVKWIKL